MADFKKIDESESDEDVGKNQPRPGANEARIEELRGEFAVAQRRGDQQRMGELNAEMDELLNEDLAESDEPLGAGDRMLDAAARLAAGETVGKSAGPRGDVIVKNAAQLATGEIGGCGFTKAEYEETLDEICKREALPGELEGDALCRLAKADPRVHALLLAARAAEGRATPEDAARPRTSSEMAKRLEAQEDIEKSMQERAIKKRRRSETVEQCYTRLLMSDRKMKELAKLHKCVVMKYRDGFLADFDDEDDLKCSR